MESSGQPENGAPGSPATPATEGTHGWLEQNLRGADDEAFARTLGETVSALESARIPYVLIGGIASSGFGRPRWTHDIDVFVRPEHALKVLDALGHQGFTTEKTDPKWIYKAFKHEVMVDIIFWSKGGFYLDR